MDANLEETRKKVEELDKQLGLLSMKKRKLNDVLLENDTLKHKQIFNNIVNKVFYYESDSSIALIKPISCTQFHMYNICTVLKFTVAKNAEKNRIDFCKENHRVDSIVEMPIATEEHHTKVRLLAKDIIKEAIESFS